MTQGSISGYTHIQATVKIKVRVHATSLRSSLKALYFFLFIISSYLCKMAHIISFRSAEQPGLAAQAHQIRKLVFVEEQGVDPELEYDEFEDEAMHYLLYAEEAPVSTARWRISGEGIKLERFATLRDFRNRGLGSIMLKELMKDIIPMGRKIYLHSQLRAIPFYHRHGFKKTGKQFTEADIEHYKMEYKPALQKNKNRNDF